MSIQFNDYDNGTPEYLETLCEAYLDFSKQYENLKQQETEYRQRLKEALEKRELTEHSQVGVSLKIQKRTTWENYSEALQLKKAELKLLEKQEQIKQIATPKISEILYIKTT